MRLRRFSEDDVVALGYRRVEGIGGKLSGLKAGLLARAKIAEHLSKAQPENFETAKSTGKWPWRLGSKERVIHQQNRFIFEECYAICFAFVFVRTSKVSV